jgi:hypothetical protein
MKLATVELFPHALVRFRDIAGTSHLKNAVIGQNGVFRAIGAEFR